MNIVAAKTPPGIESVVDGSTDGRVVVAVDASGVLAKEIRIGASIEGCQVAARGVGESQGEGGGMQDCTGVAAWKVGAGVLVGF